MVMRTLTVSICVCVCWCFAGVIKLDLDLWYGQLSTLWVSSADCCLIGV